MVMEEHTPLICTFEGKRSVRIPISVPEGMLHTACSPLVKPAPFAPTGANRSGIGKESHHASHRAPCFSSKPFFKSDWPSHIPRHSCMLRSSFSNDVCVIRCPNNGKMDKTYPSRSSALGWPAPTPPTAKGGSTPSFQRASQPNPAAVRWTARKA